MRSLSLFSRFQSRLVITLFFATVVPVIALQGFNYHMVTDMVLDKNDALLSDNLILSRNNANTVVENYQKALYQITTDEAFLSYMEALEDMEEGSAQHTRTMELVQSRVWTNILMYPEVQSVGFVDMRRRKLMISQYRVEDQPIIEFFYDNADGIYDQIIGLTYPQISVIGPESPHYSEENGMFYISYRAFNHESMKILGTVTLFVRSNVLNDAVNNSGQAAFPYSNKLIVTADDTILCSKDNLAGHSLADLPEASILLLGRGQGGLVYEDKNSSVKRADISGFDLYMLDIVDKNALLQDVRNLWLYIFLVIGAVMVMTLGIVFFASRSTVRSVNRIAGLMNNLGADSLNVIVTEKSNNEIRSIEYSYERMVERIMRLLEENRAQYDHIVEVTRASKEAELKSLELQINPHFLFNTIDTINWMAIRKGEYDISAQLGNLAGILRYTVYNVNGIATVGEEVEWMRQYLQLQQNRFHNKFDYEIHTAPDSLGCPIHKLIVQPFLENAIIHGFETIPYQGLLTVTIAVEEQAAGRVLSIGIRDNGVGIDTETVALLRDLLRNPQKATTRGIGIQNIALRLAGYYGDDARITFASQPGDTQFTLYIPQSESEEEEAPPCTGS